MKNFESWRIARNSKFKDQCPERWFEDKENLCGWLCRFVAETRKADGGEYTPRSIYLLLAGLSTEKIRQSNPKESINIFTDARFKELRNVCDSVFKRLHQKGVGSETKSTPVLTQLEEDKLWESGVLNLNTPVGVLRAVFFYNGKSFCLRGGQEQRGLKLSQITKSVESVGGENVSCYTYREFGSKNRQGGFSSLNSDNKVVKQYENLSGSGPCHVKILDIYLSKLPTKAKENDVFYLTPLPKRPPDGTKPWYTITPVGKNRLNGLLKEMCAEAGLSKDFSNHSLRAYGATTLFQAKVPEKLIQMRTGHKSIEALRCYERTSETQLLDVSHVVCNTSTPDQENMHCGEVVPYNDACKSSSSDVVEIRDQQKDHMGGKYSNNGIMSLLNASNTNIPNIVITGCNFTNCNVSLCSKFDNNKKATSNIDKVSLDELLKGITPEQLFDD